MLLHQAVQRGLLRAAPLAVNKCAIRRPPGLPVNDLHVRLQEDCAPAWSPAICRVSIAPSVAYRCVPASVASRSCERLPVINATCAKRFGVAEKLYLDQCSNQTAVLPCKPEAEMTPSAISAPTATPQTANRRLPSDQVSSTFNFPISSGAIWSGSLSTITRSAYFPVSRLPTI